MAAVIPGATIEIIQELERSPMSENPTAFGQYLVEALQRMP